MRNLSIYAICLTFLILGLQLINYENDRQHEEAINSMSQDVGVLKRTVENQQAVIERQDKEQIIRDNESEATALQANLEELEASIDQNIDEELKLRKKGHSNQLDEIGNTIAAQQLLAESLRNQIERLKSNL